MFISLLESQENYLMKICNKHFCRVINCNLKLFYKYLVDTSAAFPDEFIINRIMKNTWLDSVSIILTFQYHINTWSDIWEQLLGKCQKSSKEIEYQKFLLHLTSEEDHPWLRVCSHCTDLGMNENELIFKKKKKENNNNKKKDIGSC